LSPELDTLVAEWIEDSTQQNDCIRVILADKLCLSIFSIDRFTCTQIVVDVNEINVKHQYSQLSKMDHTPDNMHPHSIGVPFEVDEILHTKSIEHIKLIHLRNDVHECNVLVYQSFGLLILSHNICQNMSSNLRK
jgi:hypothetical protein